MAKIELAKKQLARCLEAAGDGHANISRGTLLDIQDGFDALERDQSAREAAARKAGANWMLDTIRGSFRGYPDHGGDIEIMTKVDDLLREARLAEAEWWHENSMEPHQNHNFKECRRLAELRSASAQTTELTKNDGQRPKE